MFKYFDLNNHVYIRPAEFLTKALKSQTKNSNVLPGWKQILMYLGVLIGVFFSNTVNQFQKDQSLTISFNTNILIISSIIALTIIPLVYEKLRLDPKAPILIQFGVFVQNGVFWHVLLDSLSKIFV